ncbi:MAG: methyltransferase domain-containing protein [Rubrobacter sp.]|jgi:ubiquinone/menaquinone biosynthesis C-methylase UbiE|nr:methyltransferase domain-containing protein [Rubrobacter sp.]
MGLTNPENLSSQYANASNLDRRITLHQRFSVNEASRHRWAFDHLDLPSTARILELGYGNAVLWTKNRDKITGTWRSTLADTSPGMLEDVEKNINLTFRNTLTRNLTFTSTDTQAIWFGGGAFDAVAKNHMLYHVPDRGGRSRRWRGF